MRRRIVLLGLGICFVAGCVPAQTEYPPSVTNTQLLLKGREPIAVGEFTAGERPTLNPQFAAELRKATIIELETAGRHSESSSLRLSGTLVDSGGSFNPFARSSKTDLAAEFVLTRDGETKFRKRFAGQQVWADETPMRIDGYKYYSAMQRLLTELFSDPDFQAATGVVAR